jgi:hypothetical protein
MVDADERLRPLSSSSVPDQASRGAFQQDKSIATRVLSRVVLY